MNPIANPRQSLSFGGVSDPLNRMTSGLVVQRTVPLQPTPYTQTQSIKPTKCKSLFVRAPFGRKPYAHLYLQSRIPG